MAKWLLLTQAQINRNLNSGALVAAHNLPRKINHVNIDWGELGMYEISMTLTLANVGSNNKESSVHNSVFWFL